MARYELRFKRSVTKDLRTLPKADIKRILKKLGELSETPRGPGSKKLTNREVYRARAGNYRIIYDIVEEQLVVQVIKVSHRSNVYR
jgi:mRNA interferase RelE/StbE